ncbi:MAG: hypothetical protein ABGY95_05625 [Rubritalea sp.]|uniref:hypothetical protein n=1 Tax=Rubritalea sp. TaxID=2109375 RepID=UPI0032429032
MKKINKALALAALSTLFASCNKEQEATVLTVSGVQAPISQAQQIEGVWVLNENAEKYQAELNAKYREDFEFFKNQVYIEWKYECINKRPDEHLDRLKSYEIATKYKPTKEFFERIFKNQRSWNPVMLDWFDEINHQEQIEYLKQF